MPQTVTIIPTTTGATVHARATAQATGLSLKDSLVPSFPTAAAAIATVTPDTAGRGKTYTYRAIVTGANGIRYVVGATSTADGADDLSGTGPSKANVIAFTGAIPGASTVEIYRTVAGGATTTTTGLIGTLTLSLDGKYLGATPAFSDTGGIATSPFSATNINVLPTVTVADGQSTKSLHATGVQIGLESNSSVYWTMDGSTPSSINGFLMPVLPSGINFQLGGNETAWDNFKLSGTASMQCQFSYRN